MQELQLIGMHEDGEHLLLSGIGDARFRMPVDAALRAAIQHGRPRSGQVPTEADDELRPRDVQALIRAGASSDEAANRAGWSIEKVHRYEGPILAEREHVAGLAQKARLRIRGGMSSNGASGNGASSSGGAPILSARVAERLKSRGVEATDATWDSWRVEGGPWTVVLTFAAGGRQRQASWSFDLADRAVSAIDDEARWLSEEVQEARGPIPAPRLGPTSVHTGTVYDVEIRDVEIRDVEVYDVEAEGGLEATARVEHHDDPVDLMTAMRKRSTARGRRKPGGHRGPAKAATIVTSAGEKAAEGDRAEQAGESLEQVLPLENLGYDAPADSSPNDPSESDLSSPPDSSPQEPVQAVESAESAADHGKPKAPTTRRVRESARKTGRPSVPAWDEIMFGSSTPRS